MRCSSDDKLEIEMIVRTGGHVILSWQRPMPPAVVETSLRALARVHAWGWGGRGLPPTHWTPLMVTTNATSRTVFTTVTRLLTLIRSDRYELCRRNFY